jgi:hypothetical protein
MPAHLEFSNEITDEMVEKAQAPVDQVPRVES